MNVLHVSTHFHPCVGGKENYLLNLCTHLNGLGHKNEVVCLNTCAKSDKKLKAEETFKGIKIHRTEYFGKDLYKISPKVIGFATKKDIDLIHVHGIGFLSDYLALTKAIHRKPLVLSTLGGFFHTKEKIWLKKAYLNSWCRIVFRAFDGIIASGVNDYKLFKKLSPKTKLIEAGVEIKKFSKKKKKEKGRILFLGRISKNKRIDNLINTFFFVAKEKPKAKLVIAGEDWEGLSKEYEKLVKEKGMKGKVFFKGKISERKLVEEISRAEFIISASEYEGFGISVVEGMASGAIPILNKISAFERFVRNGRNGFLVEFNEAKKAGEKISRIMNLNEKKKKRIAEKAIKSVQKYDWSEVVKRIEKEYKDCINK
ncbi:MAG: glycosyltransferase family 4 protein [archaeon]